MTTLRRNQVDLHCHTRRSDGLLEPAALYAAARDYGMRLVAVTDHDTLDGYRELRAAGHGAVAGPDGPQLLCGVELNTAADLPAAAVNELHILGLGVDADDDEFEALLSRLRDARRRRILRMAALLRSAGAPVDEQLAVTLPVEVSAAGRPHLGRALVLAGHASSLDEAMARFLVPGARAWVPREGIGPLEAIAAVRRAGGLASLAHFPSAPDQVGLLRELKEAGLGGLEVHYRSFRPATVVAVGEVAGMLGLVPTGGSDYHGDLMTYADAQDQTRVPLDVGEALLAALGRRTVSDGTSAAAN